MEDGILWAKMRVKNKSKQTIPVRMLFKIVDTRAKGVNLRNLWMCISKDDCFASYCGD